MSNKVIIRDPLIEPYEIWVDTDQYTVGIPKTTIDKDGNDLENLTKSKYYNSLETALKYLVKVKIIKENKSFDNIGEYIKTYHNFLREFQNLFV